MIGKILKLDQSSSEQQPLTLIFHLWVLPFETRAGVIPSLVERKPIEHKAGNPKERHVARGIDPNAGIGEVRE